MPEWNCLIVIILPALTPTTSRRKRRRFSATFAASSSFVQPRFNYPRLTPGSYTDDTPPARVLNPCRSHGYFSHPDARIALAGVDMVPVRAGAAEALLTGEVPGPQLWEAAGAEAMSDLRPTSDIHATGAYRRHVAGVLTTRALARAAGAVSIERRAG